MMLCGSGLRADVLSIVARSSAMVVNMCVIVLICVEIFAKGSKKGEIVISHRKIFTIFTPLFLLMCRYMKCAIIGHGKMGREIEKILAERGHSVEIVIDEDNAAELTPENIAKVDVAFEFTTPDTAAENVAKVLRAGGRVVCGTTGWLSRMKEMEALAVEHGGALFYASNYSIGVNVMFRLNRRLAELMNPHAQYEVRIEETHHMWKKDAPSGTAITLAEGVIENLDRKSSWVNSAPMAAEQLEIESFREGMTPGIHTVTYTSADDFIELKHSIINRRALAMGAVVAGEFLSDKAGVYSMDNLL